MWTAIFASIVEIVRSWFGIKKVQEETKQREFEIKNTEEEKAREEKREDIRQRDIAEDLVKTAIEGTEQEKNEALEEIRRRAAG